MPGKTPANRAGKDSGSSSGELSGGGKSNKFSIWPKWTDDEPASDKKESTKPTGGDSASRARKGTALSGANVAVDKNTEDDILPPSLKEGGIDWIQPGLFIVAPETPVVVVEPVPNEIDLTSKNTHLMKSELMCSVISQLRALWHYRSSPKLASRGPDGAVLKEWRPWDHIQHKKEHVVPMLNPQGQYAVKIFWMGAWRKIQVTDNLPLSKEASKFTPENENKEPTTDDAAKDGKGEVKENVEKRVMLLPRTANSCELWPAILTKAILKVAALDYKGGSEWREFGDCSVIHMLTGWCPQTLTTRIESDVLWGILCQSLALWRRPDEVLPGGSQEEGGVSPTPAKEGGGGEKGEGETGSRMVTAQFTSASNGEPLAKARETIMAEAVGILRESGVVSEKFEQRRDHTQCVFVRQIRDIPLLPPPKEPPPIPAPEEHAWLGYSLRRYEPWKGPPPKSHPPRWVEVLTVKEEEGEQTEEHLPHADEPETEVEGGRSSGRSFQEGEGHTEGGGIWMKFEDFRKAFSSVEVYSSPSQFRFTQSYKDMTATVEMATQEETKGKGRASHSPANKKGTESCVADDTNILFIEERKRETVDPNENQDVSEEGQNEDERRRDLEEDDSKEVELHFVFSCLSNWREGSKDMKTDRKKSTALQKRRESILSNPLTQRHCFKYSMTKARSGLRTSTYAFAGGAPPISIPEADEDCSSVGSSVFLPPSPYYEEEEEEEVERVVAGVLVVEEFNWKSMATKMPLLRLATTAVKGAVLKLEKSKIKMLKFHVKAPLGYHLSISSNSDFVLYNEDSAYNRMHKEGIGFSKIYSGAIPTLPPHSWAVVFREVLQVRREDQFLAFSLDCPVPGHQLRVVDNGDGQEMPRVAHITEPQTYDINKGYTILCEMWTNSEPVLEESTWKLRVISSDPHLPLCQDLEREDEVEEQERTAEEKKREGGGEAEGEGEIKVSEVAISTEFSLKEVRDYCLPDRDSVLFRHSLRTSRECPITVQLTTSKRDAHIKLEILDGGLEGKLVAVSQGRAYCSIPALHILPITTGEDSAPAHKYVMVASVTHDSWPLSDTAWPHIAEIRSAEEERASMSGGGGGGAKGKKPPSASSKGAGKSKKAKGGKEAGGKEISEGVQSSPSLSAIDATKPHWTLRVAIRQRDREQFEMGKDTEREEELRAMQTAWETQQPGRLKKGAESRQKFLDANAQKPTNSTEDHAPGSTTSLSSQPQATPSLYLQPPHAPLPLERIDLSLYTKYSHAAPHVLTAEERERRDEERREMIRQYRAWRHSILQSRDEDRQCRNEDKLRQLEEAEKQQSELEATRKRMNRGRERIRQAHLAEEKARREAELEALKAAEEEAAANSARDSKAKGKKGKKK